LSTAPYLHGKVVDGGPGGYEEGEGEELASHGHNQENGGSKLVHVHDSVLVGGAGDVREPTLARKRE
jgi:hypothetical protein